MNEGAALRHLSEVNPWWSDPAWREHDEALLKAQLAPFDYHPGVLADLEEGGLFILRGVRRSGKSVAMKQAISSLLHAGVLPRRVIHFACDDLSMDDFDVLVRVARGVSTAGVEEPRYWFIDEITSLKGRWSRSVKKLRDQTPFGRDTVVLTGSSMAGLQEAQDDLAGRRGPATRSDRLLFPMGFRQFWAAMGYPRVPYNDTIHPAELRSPRSRQLLQEFVPAFIGTFLPAWEAYLQVGGLPNAVADFRTTSAVSDATCQAMFDVIVADLRRGSKSVNQGNAQALLTVLSDRLANPTNAAGLARLAGLHVETIQKRIEKLTEAFVLWPCRLMERNRPNMGAERDDDGSPSGDDQNAPASDQRPHPKLYFTDPLLANLASSRNAGLVRPDSSVLTEQQVGLALLRQAELRDPGTYADFTHVLYGKTTRKEIDFVGSWMRQVALEAKYVDDGWRAESQTVRSATKEGILLTRTAFDLSEDAWAVPAPVLVWMLEPET